MISGHIAKSYVLDRVPIGPPERKPVPFSVPGSEIRLAIVSNHLDVNRRLAIATEIEMRHPMSNYRISTEAQASAAVE